jgi:hypothetical protein
MAHLDKDYVFGVKIPPDDCTVGEILQHSPNKDSKEFLRDLIFNKGDDVGTKSTAFARFRNRAGKGEEDLSYISVSEASYHPRNISYQKKDVYQKRHALPKSLFKNDESSGDNHNMKGKRDGWGRSKYCI